MISPPPCLSRQLIQCPSWVTPIIPFHALSSWVLSFITLLVLYSPVPIPFESHTQCRECPLKNPCPPCNLKCSQEVTSSRKPPRVNWMRELIYPTLQLQATSPTPSEAAPLLWSISWGFPRGLTIPIGSTSGESSSSCVLPLLVGGMLLFPTLGAHYLPSLLLPLLCLPLPPPPFPF